MVTLSDKQYASLVDFIENAIEEKLDQKLDEKLKYLPTKDEFYKQSAEIMKELKAIRDNTDVLGEQVNRNSDRLDRVEKHLDLPTYK